MVQLPKVLLFVAVTFISWGVYGVLLHQGKNAMGESSLRPFVAVGVAYFIIAVVGSSALLAQRPEKGKWTLFGAALSIFAGSIGALGALGVILALKYKGSPLYVMPLVFGGAPVINTLVTSWLGKTFKQISPLFITGLVLVALGATGVLVTKPAAPSHAAPHVETAEPTTTDATTAASSPTNAENSESKASEAQTSSTDKVSADPKQTQLVESEPDVDKATDKSVVKADPLKITLSILMAIVCWGGYGPFLHLGQMKMEGSRLRPFLCVGIAYFIIAIAVPMLFLAYFPDAEPGNWGVMGFLWSLAAGAAGAVGALGIIMAFNYGGKPIYVMPLIFGFAPVVNTFVTIFLSNSFGEVNAYFLASMAVVIAGAVTVLIFAPKSKPHAVAAPAYPAADLASDDFADRVKKKLPWDKNISNAPSQFGEATGNPLIPPNPPDTN